MLQIRSIVSKLFCLLLFPSISVPFSDSNLLIVLFLILPKILFQNDESRNKVVKSKEKLTSLKNIFNLITHD